MLCLTASPAISLSRCSVIKVFPLARCLLFPDFFPRRDCCYWSATLFELIRVISVNLRYLPASPKQRYAAVILQR